ncbi:MAG: SDR family oxidoreductase [Nitrospira sp.]|nr:SDR family oxidoreductase [Nitrospira sp.]
MRLKDKVAIVTGGGTGIGEAIAKAFANEGAKVVVTGRRKDELERVVRVIERAKGRALAAPGSVTQETDVRAAVDAAVRAYGRVDVLVNNAGNLFHAGPLHETSDQIWNETLDIFLTGTFRFTRAVIPHMLKQGGGSIINISTVGGLKAIPFFPGHAYQAAKAGVVMFTKTVAVHYAKDKIRCNCICPAAVETPGVAEWLKDPKTRTTMDAMHPLGRMGNPDEIAPPAVYFASDEAAWTTGAIMPIDGGLMAQ